MITLTKEVIEDVGYELCIWCSDADSFGRAAKIALKRIRKASGLSYSQAALNIGKIRRDSFSDADHMKSLETSAGAPSLLNFYDYVAACEGALAFQIYDRNNRLFVAITHGNVSELDKELRSAIRPSLTRADISIDSEPILRSEMGRLRIHNGFESIEKYVERTGVKRSTAYAEENPNNTHQISLRPLFNNIVARSGGVEAIILSKTNMPLTRISSSFRL